MKKITILLLLLVAVFVAFSTVTACKSSPPPEEEFVEPPPPPPEPDPPPPPPEPDPVDTSPPVVTFTISPQPFSPDEDGVDDLLIVKINVETKSEISEWHIIVYEPESDDQIFSEWKGEGTPPEALEWDGRSINGELVESAANYHFSLTVSNIYGESFYDTGTVSIDVLAVREAGGVLRAIVPNIVFAPDARDFTGLDADIMEENDYILRRIAEALAYFSGYKVKVEGYVNPTTPPGTRARINEEVGNKIISEARAKAVVDYLVGLGIDPDRLSYEGMGSSRPMAEFTDRDNWWKNRRVEFLLEK